MSRRGQLKGPELIRNRATKTYTVASTPLSGIAVALFLAFSALICSFAPRYFELATLSVGSVVWLVVAGILGLIGIGGLVYEIRLIRGSLIQNADAWVSASIAAFFALVVVAVHLVAVVGLGLTGWLGMSARVIVIVFGFLFALALAATIDDFFIKPRLGTGRRKLTKDQRPARNQLIGNIGAVILWFLTVISTVLTLLDRIFGQTPPGG